MDKFEKPRKLRRVEDHSSSSIIINSQATLQFHHDEYGEEKKEDLSTSIDVVNNHHPSTRLQHLIQQLARQTLACVVVQQDDDDDEEITEMDEILQQIEHLLLSTVRIIDYFGIGLIQQLNGLLLQWLDYLVTHQKPRDITNVCDTESKDTVSLVSQVPLWVQQICDCLKHIPANHHDDDDDETMYILVRALLWFGKDESYDEDTSIPLPSILQVIERRTRSAGLIQLPPLLEEQFLLRLLKMCREHSQNNEYRTARSVLEHLTRNRNTILSRKARIVTNTINFQRGEVLIEEPIDLFQFQCHLQRHDDDWLKHIGLLVKIIMTDHNDMGVRQRALDCIVMILSHHKDVSIVNKLDHILILKAMVRVLTHTTTKQSDDTMNIWMKLRAVQILQYFFDGINAENNLTTFLQLIKDTKQFTSSMLSLSDIDFIKHNCKQYYYCMSFANSNSLSIGAAEILLSCIAVSLNNGATFLSHNEITTICEQLLQLDSEHITYLVTRMICRDCKSYFLKITMRHTDLLSTLALVLQESDTTIISKQSILRFWYDLVKENTSAAQIIIRQDEVLSAIASLARRDVDDTTNALAIKLLFALSEDVCNRRMMVKQSKVLASMIHFVRELDEEDRQDDTFSHIDRNLQESGDNFRNEQNTESPRKIMKRRVLELASIL